MERLIYTPENNLARFKEKLSGLNNPQKFVPWSMSGYFVRALSRLRYSQPVRLLRFPLL